LHKVVFIIKSLYKRGTKRLCKALLKSQRLDAVDTDTVHEFERVLTDAGLLADIESIVDDDDSDDDQTYEVPVKETDIAHTQTPQFASSQPSYDDYDTVHTQPSQSNFIDAFYPPS
jgi:hypothetical protein